MDNFIHKTIFEQFFIKQIIFCTIIIKNIFFSKFLLIKKTFIYKEEYYKIIILLKHIY